MIRQRSIVPVSPTATLVAVAIAMPLPAQVWSAMPSSGAPPARAVHALATDLTAGRVVLFGGASGLVYLGDTWQWDGAAWSQVLGPGPAARGRHAMAFDDRRGSAVLFGGINGVGINNWFSDTWEYAASAWTQRATTNHPAVRFGHAMAFDRGRGRVVMFGGRTRSGTIFLNDTWEWDGVDWLPMTPAHAPSPRMGHGLAFAAPGRQVLLFGGLQLGGPFVGDTWTWDGLDWTQLAPAHAPSPRADHALATDLARGRTVLYGGYDGGDLVDTFEWDGVDWRQVATATAPGPLALPAMTTGPTGRHVVLFGGDDAGGAPQQGTWRFGELAAVRAFGSGCGTPPLTSTAGPGSVPAIGTTFTSTLAPVPSGALPAQSLGFSATTLGGVPLPLDLGIAGMPGCWLYHDLAELYLPCTLAGDTATHALTIPLQPAFVGVEIYLQAYALAPGSNAFGAITGNALALLLGWP